MRITSLTLQEIKFRFWTSLLNIVLVTAAVCFLLVNIFNLVEFEQESESYLSRKQIELERLISQMSEEYRKIGVGMGFNVLILPKDQNITDFFAEDYASKYMPEAFADSLANSRIVSVRHILPSLSKKITWKERNRKIILTGIRDEIPKMHGGSEEVNKNPILQAVPKGKIILGYELHTSLSIKPNDKILLDGQEFIVDECYDQRGNLDDITVWIDLKAAQKILNKENQINAIMALECRCIGDENFVNLAKIREEIQSILPGTQVLEFMSKAIARAESRWQIIKVGQQELDKERAQRATLRKEKQKNTFLQIGLIAVIVGAILFIMTYINTRSRKHEIGMLRALGFSLKCIFQLFIFKQILLGFLGALWGTIFSIIIMIILEISWTTIFSTTALLIYGELLIVTPIFCSIMALLPVISGVLKDPSRALESDG